MMRSNGGSHLTGVFYRQKSVPSFLMTALLLSSKPSARGYASSSRVRKGNTLSMDAILYRELSVATGKHLGLRNFSATSPALVLQMKTKADDKKQEEERMKKRREEAEEYERRKLEEARAARCVAA